MAKLIPFVFALSLAACAGVPPPEETPPSADPAPAEVDRTATRILDRAAAERLLAADGVTLQWIGWDRRGSVNARMDGGTLLLTAAQNDENGPGRLFLDGYVSEIGSDYFTFVGTIRMTDTPDPGRRCEATKSWHFAITQNRPYWRLREFEWCDSLTDYIDIYF